ncbi:hypothetical protein [Kitasatospora sp. CB01950]|uniref:hypothetical protein n=1 Tax=Kitasatospora sp. CB01950 TaxID=1703930 RepID=UPI000938E7CD|nr:hypothetical protein [Kitasatospora sp. CB01950]OKJ06637.1 hypothetical protein AMK19_22315 [Kitasatospora sp. CB01950]
MPALPEHDFEDRLCQVFRETGESFVPDTPTLTAGGATRGRRRQRRRLTLGAAAAVLLVSGATAAVLPGDLYTDGVGPATSATPSPFVSDPSGAARIPQEAHLVSAVAERLPAELKILRSDGSAVGSAAFPTTRAWASLTLDDGDGPTQLTVDIYRAGGPPPENSCPAYSLESVICQEAAQDDGSKVTVVEWTEASARRGRTAVQWDTADGLKVVVSSTGYATANGRPRAKPLLSVTRLWTLATDPGWRAFAGPLSRTLPKLPVDAPVQRPDLLPPGLKVLSSTSGPEQTATLTDQDRRVVLHFAQQEADETVRTWFADAPVLPDDTRIRSVENRPVPNAQGATETVVDILRPDGNRVRVTAVNPAGADDADAGRAPLVSLDRLTAIAMCPGWTVPPAN